MRLAVFLFCVILFMVVRFGCTKTHIAMCARICDHKDLELDKIEPGILRTKCTCGHKKVHIYDIKKP